MNNRYFINNDPLTNNTYYLAIVVTETKIMYMNMNTQRTEYIFCSNSRVEGSNTQLTFTKNGIFDELDRHDFFVWFSTTLSKMCGLKKVK